MKQYIRCYFMNNVIEYIKVVIIFAISFIISIIVINNSNDIQKKELTDYINNKIEIVKNTEFNNSTEICINSLKNNLSSFVILVFLSSSIIGIPFAYFIIAKKGFFIGYTISAIAATQNTKTAIIFICNSMLFHNIIYLISMFMVLVSGINFSRSLLKGKKENVKFEILRYFIFILLAFVLIIIASLFEVYISTNFLYLLKKYL